MQAMLGADQPQGRGSTLSSGPFAVPAITRADCPGPSITVQLLMLGMCIKAAIASAWLYIRTHAEVGRKRGTRGPKGTKRGGFGWGLSSLPKRLVKTLVCCYAFPFSERRLRALPR